METKESVIGAFRFGYGLPGLANGLGSAQDLLDQLARAEPVPARLRNQASSPRILEIRQKISEFGSSSGPERRRKRVKVSLAQRDYLEGDSHERVTAAVESEFPFFERLVSFWSNHFTVSVKDSAVRALAGPFEVEAIRPHLMGNFRDLLRAVELHPAMIRYLNLGRSVGPNSVIGQRETKGESKGLNENLAREILELHTLGVNGGYTQEDVTSFAKIMTGWSIGRQDGRAEFDSRRAEPGTKAMLGAEFGSAEPDSGAYPQALDFLAQHRSTATFIATKLTRHFLADEPDQDSIAKLADAFSASKGDLPAVYRALVNLEASWTAGRKARSPIEFVVACLRTAQVQPELLAAIDRNGRKIVNPLSVGALVELAQPLWRAPSPAGWSERADEWLSPTGLALRLQWIPKVVALIKDETAGTFLERVLGPKASEQTRSVVKAASSREEGLSLVLASPEFNWR